MTFLQVDLVALLGNRDRGAELSHHQGDCSFETIPRRYHVDSPEEAELDIMLRGLSRIGTDEQILLLIGPVFDYGSFRRAMLPGREPA